MTRDYKNSAPKPKPAAAPAAPSKPKVPGFVWGAFFGIAAALVAMWWLQPKPAETVDSPVAGAESSPQPAAAVSPAAAPPVSEQVQEPAQQELPPARKSKFQFYRLLHDYEVIVADEEEPLNVPTAVPPPRGNDSAESAVAAFAKPSPKGYMIQVGSFRGAAEAERRRAELGLLGLRARIEPVDVAVGETWHRVRIGPLPVEAEVQDVATMLEGERLDYLVSRVR